MAKTYKQMQVQGVQLRSKGRAYRCGSSENTINTSICQYKHPLQDMCASMYNVILASGKVNALQAAENTNARQESA